MNEKCEKNRQHQGSFRKGEKRATRYRVVFQHFLVITPHPTGKGTFDLLKSPYGLDHPPSDTLGPWIQS